MLGVGAIVAIDVVVLIVWTNLFPLMWESRKSEDPVSTFIPSAIALFLS